MHHLSKSRIFYLYDLDWQTGRGGLPAFTANPDTPSVQQLYQASAPMKMGRWLMIDVTDEQILEDVKNCLSCEPTDLGKKQSKIKRK